MKIKSASVKIITIGYICILAVIIYLADTKSTQTLLNFVGNIPYGDKLGHFFLMGIFSVLVNWCLNFKRISWILLGSLIVFVIVTLEEISQIFIRGRSFDWSDLIADFLGILILGEIANLIFKRFFKE